MILWLQIYLGLPNQRAVTLSSKIVFAVEFWKNLVKVRNLTEICNLLFIQSTHIL